jgi:hypothetical protein
MNSTLKNILVYGGTFLGGVVITAAVDRWVVYAKDREIAKTIIEAEKAKQAAAAAKTATA